MSNKLSIYSEAIGNLTVNPMMSCQVPLGPQLITIAALSITQAPQSLSRAQGSLPLHKIQ